MTGAGPLFPRKTTRGHADCLPRAIRPRCTPPRRGRSASDFRCPRELDVLLLCVGSRETPGRVHGPLASLARRPGSCTLYQYRRGSLVS